MAVDKGAVSRLVLDHNIAVYVGVDAEVYVADTLKRIVYEDEIASRVIAAEDEAGRGVLQIGRKSQDDGIVAMPGRVGLEAAGMILELVVRLDIDVVLSNDVR